MVSAPAATVAGSSGWRVLRAPGQLDAQWRDSEGRWARFSVRFSAREDPGDASDVLFERPVGAGTVSVTFDCSDLDEVTIGMAQELLTPLQRILARFHKLPQALFRVG